MVDDDDGRTDDGRTPDHGHPISSPCEPYGSGELKILNVYGLLNYRVQTDTDKGSRMHVRDLAY